MVSRKVDGSCSKGWGREGKKKTMDLCVGKQEEEKILFFFIIRPNQKLLYQWSRELQGEYDSMAENIFTSQGLGLCKQSFTGLTIKSNLQNRLENPGV